MLSWVHLYTNMLFDFTVQRPLRSRLCILKYNIILQIVIHNEPNCFGFFLFFFWCCNMVYQFACFKLDKINNGAENKTFYKPLAVLLFLHGYDNFSGVQFFHSSVSFSNVTMLWEQIFLKRNTVLFYIAMYFEKRFKCDEVYKHLFQNTRVWWELVYRLEIINKTCCMR